MKKLIKKKLNRKKPFVRPRKRWLGKLFKYLQIIDETLQVKVREHRELWMYVWQAAFALNGP